ncbi:MAG: class I SAM-dependent methyltransferase [Candidatus Nealsonbacteria bacterium]|nr:class I SAM-dependent methyltransferase [Candidatus Nealsonbacteria bacterium]
MKKEYAAYLLEKTKNDYNLISDDFSRTRNKNWEELKFFADNVAVNKRVLDLGCGNGRLYELFKDKIVGYCGIDISEKLIEIAKSRYPRARFRVGDALNLPFSDNLFDNVFGIAVFHHIPSKEFRFKFLNEAKRVLKPKGKLFLTVWYLPRRKKALLIFKNLILRIVGLSKIDLSDSFVGWGDKTQRYVHYFSMSEIKGLVERVGLSVKEIRILKRPESEESNIVLVAEK